MYFLKEKINSFNNFLIIIFFYFYFVSLFMGAAGQTGHSYSFFFGFFIFLLKLAKIFFQKKSIIFNKVIIAILVLFFYLFFLDLFLGNILHKRYYFTKMSNIIMLLILFDEFKDNIKFRNNSFYFLIVILVLISLISKNTFFSLTGDDERKTFKFFNHNTYAFFLLFPYVYIFIFAITQKKILSKIMNYFLFFFYLFILVILLDSIFDTGSRFPIYIIFLFLLSLFAMSYFWKLNSSSIYLIFTIATYFLYKIFFSDFHPFRQGYVMSSNLFNNLSNNRYDLLLNTISNTTNVIFGSGVSEFFLKMKGVLPHNLFMEIYGSGGIVGIILLLIVAYLLCCEVLSEKIYLNKLILIINIALLFFSSIYINVIFEKIWWLILAFTLSINGSKISISKFLTIERKKFSE